MENIQNLANQLPEYAKDIRINVATLISEQNQALTTKQIAGSVLACVLMLGNSKLIAAASADAEKFLSAAEINGAKIATTLMAMNNVYYRFVHLTNDAEYSQMQTGLRMQGIATHGIEKVDFEVFALAVSVINGCGYCVEAHARQLGNHGFSKTQIQMVGKIAAVVNALKQVIALD